MNIDIINFEFQLVDNAQEILTFNMVKLSRHSDFTIETQPLLMGNVSEIRYV